MNDPVWLLARLLGYGKEEVVGKSIYDYIQEETGWSLNFISELASLKSPRKIREIIESNV